MYDANLLACTCKLLHKQISMEALMKTFTLAALMIFSIVFNASAAQTLKAGNIDLYRGACEGQAARLTEVQSEEVIIRVIADTRGDERTEVILNPRSQSNVARGSIAKTVHTSISVCEDLRRCVLSLESDELNVSANCSREKDASGNSVDVLKTTFRKN